MPVNVVELTKSTSVFQRHTYYGALRPQREGSLGFSRGGQIHTMHKSLGAAVSKGEELAALDMGTSEADLAKVREAQQAAEQKLAGYQSSPNVNVLRAEIAAARQQVEQLQGQAAELQAEINRAKIIAPYDCLLAETFFDEGASVPAGRPVVRVIENAVPQVEVDVAREIADQLLPDQSLQVVLGDEEVEAKPVSLSPEVNAASHTTRLILELGDDTEPRLWQFGAVVEVRFWQPTTRSGFWVPHRAMQQAASGLWSVYVVTGEESPIVQRRSVEVLQVDDELALVAGSLNEGDQLLVDGLNRVVAGQSVEATVVPRSFPLPGPSAPLASADATE